MEQLMIRNGVLEPKTAQKLAELERTIKEMVEAEKELKQAILEAMERENIIKLEDENVSISYIAPFDRESFDSKAFRKDYPDIFDEYVRMTQVKPSVRIKLK